MAQAQVTITAVDRTQVAINSAMRSMKTLERTAKVTAKAVNLAFGFFTGGILVNAFGKIIDAAKKTQEGARSVENLKKVLQDPALVASASALTKTLVDGFVVAAGGIVAFSKLVRNELLRLGAIEAASSDDAIKVLENKIADIRRKYNFTVKGEKISSPITKADLDLIAEYEKRIALLSDPLQRGRGEGGRRGRAPQLSELNRMENQFKVRQQMAKITADQEAKTAEAAKKLAAEITRLNEMTMTSTEKTIAGFVEFQKAIDSLLRSGVINQGTATARMMEKIDEILPEIEVTGKREIIPGAQEKLTQLTVFAEEAARQMQQSFAAFLFDPFQDGLRGMLRGFVDMIRQMLAQIISQQLLVAFFNMFTGGTGFLANFANAAIKSIEGRANGGSVSRGRPYIVGERGPELFVPGSSGGIVPNGAMMGGMTVAPVYNIDARGATADLQSALPGILQENNRRIFEELDRRYGVGR